MNGEPGSIANGRWTATLEVGTEDYDTIALGKRNLEELLAGVASATDAA